MRACWSLAQASSALAAVASYVPPVLPWSRAIAAGFWGAAGGGDGSAAGGAAPPPAPAVRDLSVATFLRSCCLATSLSARLPSSWSTVGASLAIGSTAMYRARRRGGLGGGAERERGLGRRRLLGGRLDVLAALGGLIRLEGEPVLRVGLLVEGVERHGGVALGAARRFALAKRAASIGEVVVAAFGRSRCRRRLALLEGHAVVVDGGRASRRKRGHL